MTITARIQEKLENYRTHVLMAIDYFSQERFYEAAVRFRMSAEAYMKVIIYEHLGDVHGHEVILGHKLQNGVERRRGHSLFYYELQGLCNAPNNNWIDTKTATILEGIKDKSNAGAHDSNAVFTPAEFASQLEECNELSENLTKKLYTHIGRTLPEELTNAYRDKVVDAATISALRMIDMDYFVEQMDNFDKGNRYILVAPFSTQGISETLLRNLMGIRWSMIIDFNFHTQEPGGIYHSMLPTIVENCTPFTILNRDGLSNNMSKGTNGNINWIYANGLSSLQGTVTADINAWIGKRMHHFLRDALTEFCKKSLSRIYIISLLDEAEYLAEIIHQFDSIDFAERDLITFSVISENAIVRDDALKLSRYGFDIQSYNFTLQSFLSQIGDFMQPEERHTILIPSRNAQNETVQLDVTDIYSKLLANGISVIHHSIASEGDRDIKKIPAFYQGETITWKELEAAVDVERSKYEELRRKILDRLKGRQSQKFLLYHMAGAGGTTISRRLAYDLRDQAPTIIINEYVKGTTFNLIELLSMKVNLPMLAIIESAKVGNIDDLISECNAKKRIVVFVYVERVLRRPQLVNQPLVEFITDKMRNPEEKTKFSYKVQLYNPDMNMEWLNKTPYNNCEVLDFSMSIAEKNYSKDALRSYIRYYLNHLSEPIAEFLAYVSLIYYYAQRSVSDLVFRKIFKTSNGKTGLIQYLRSNQQEKQYMDKLITDDSDGLSEDHQWRPRYSVFADIMLEFLLGGTYPDKWKIALPEWSRKLIKTIKDNYEYLTEDVQKMLVAVFLERDKEDLLGQEEVWGARGAQEKFSQLLDDMSASLADQKAILKLLAETYPTVSHFWGHLARYCYENADTPDEFKEAAEYIDRALEKSGRSDYNLLHIAGMCRRRQIEYYRRKEQVIDLDNLKTLTATAREYFRLSREANSKNVHAYTSEIQLLTIVIEYGKSLSDYDKYYTFLVARENAWFFELYENLNDLIEELTMLVTQMSTLGQTNRINRTKTMLAKSESKSWQYIGDYKESLRTLQEHIRTADRLLLPRLRLIYVRTLLLSKVGGKHEDIINAWSQLSPTELQLASEYLNKNVQQNSGDVMSMKLWIQMVRYSSLDISIDEVKSRLNMMYKNSDDYPMTQLEAAYNLYMLNLFELIRDNDTLNSRKKEEIQHWIDISRELSPNDKYPYEWLLHIDGISGIISSKSKTEDTLLEHVTGTVSSIKSSAQGTIRLDCGFDAFFTPSVGNFIQGKDETTRVTMVIAFRHEGPAAYEVVRLSDKEKDYISPTTEESTQDLEIGDVEPIVEPKVELAVEEKQVEEWKQPKVELPKLKVIGKIDLEQFKKYERPKKSKKK